LEKEAQYRLQKANEDKVMNYRQQRELERKTYSAKQYERIKETTTDDLRKEGSKYNELYSQYAREQQMEKNKLTEQ